MMPSQDVDGSARRRLRLVPPLEERPPSSLDLAVGDLVVYASHGIGRVESTQANGEDVSETIVLVFESGLRVTLPHGRACAALRPLSSAGDLEDVRRALNADVPPMIEPWSRRYRSIRDKVAGGNVTGLAEVVRDGLQRERGLAASGRPAAPTERELYRQARKLLVAEIAACCGIEAAAADAWIGQQLGPEHAQS
jgi:RNA polymerase-interacting CarD/CdnL/TRCF family regulator